MTIRPWSDLRPWIGLLLAGGLGAAACGGSEFVAGTGGNGTQGTGGTGGSSSSTGGSTGTGGGTSSSSSSSSGNTGSEDCIDGKDNDADGKADCADPKCGAVVVCVEAPDGWNGPLAIEIGDQGQTGQCGPSWTQSDLNKKIGKPATPPAVCTCDCDAKSACSSGIAFTGVGCDPLPAPTPAPENHCQALNLPPLGGFAVGSEPQLGPCAPVFSENFPPAQWVNKEARVCGGTTAVGCDSGKACVEKLAASANHRICVTHSGDLACPPGYSNKTVNYDSVTDSRFCSQCACGALQDTDCSGKIMLFGDTQCGNSVGGVNTDGSCSGLPPGNVIGSFKYTPNNAGFCNHSGGTPGGSLDPVNPVTVCCK